MKPTTCCAGTKATIAIYLATQEQVSLVACDILDSFNSLAVGGAKLPVSRKAQAMCRDAIGLKNGYVAGSGTLKTYNVLAADSLFGRLGRVRGGENVLVCVLGVCVYLCAGCSIP